MEDVERLHHPSKPYPKKMDRGFYRIGDVGRLYQPRKALPEENR
jgi:hypothetical protein